MRVGLLMMVPPGEPTFAYIRPALIDWLESAGLTVVPISPAVSGAEAAAYFEYIHGLVLPDGWVDHESYAALVKLFVTMATDANRAGDYFPIWGTCRGFQFLVSAFGGTLESMNALGSPETARLLIHSQSTGSRLLSFSRLHDFVPAFNHQHGISLPRFMRSKRLRQTFRILTTSHDRDGKEYVSLMEGRTLPFYGAQFHPELERPALDWMVHFFAAELAKSKHGGFDPKATPTPIPGPCLVKHEELDCLRIEL